jgi:uncharacterized membrane protein
VAKGGFNTTLPPHELVIVNVPVLGGVVVVMVPVTEYVPAGHAVAPGVAVKPVMLQRIAQLVVPSVPGAF